MIIDLLCALFLGLNLFAAFLVVVKFEDKMRRIPYGLAPILLMSPSLMMSFLRQNNW